MNVSDEVTRELAVSFTPEGEKTLQAQLAALLPDTPIDIYQTIKASLDKAQIMDADGGHTFRFWSMPKTVPDEPLFVGVIRQAIKHLHPNHFRFLRVTDANELEEFGAHDVFSRYFTVTYVPLIAV